MLISYPSAYYASHILGDTRPRTPRFRAMHQASGREYRLVRARALSPGNERGCVEPPELERSPQLVTAGRNVRRWCLLTASIPRRLISIYLHLIAILPRHTSLYPAFSHLSPPYHFSAAPRFCISLNVNNLQFCLGEISPKQNHNRHANSHLQKRPVPIMLKKEAGKSGSCPERVGGCFS